MGQALPNTESIFDFFYVDTLKIKSFYAQLTGNGALTSLKHTNQVADARVLEATVGIPTVAGGKGGNTHTANRGSEHQYDASPTMPREMIDRLDELGYIHRELSDDMLGNLVLYKGTLGVVDVGVAKDLVEPALNLHLKELLAGNQQQKNSANEIKKNLKDMISFVKSIPFAVEARLLVSTGEKNESGVQLANEIWMSLSRDEMVGSPHDLNFKHGEYLAGELYVLGVLDAVPFDGLTFETEDNELREGITALTKMMKETMGRPATAYGLSPVAIFRVLKPKQI